MASFASAWKAIRSSEKGGLAAYRVQREILPSLGYGLGRLHAAMGIKAKVSTPKLPPHPEVDEDEESDEDDNNTAHDLSSDKPALVTETLRPTQPTALRVFVGSWNMAAKDPFVTPKGEYIGHDAASAKLEAFLPPGYDVYVLGTQEKVSNHLHAAVLARLDRAIGGRANSSYVALHRRDRNTRRPRGSSSNSTASEDSESSRVSAFAVEASGSVPCSPLAPPLNMDHAQWALPPTHVSAEKQKPIKEVCGRGDGAFLTPKATSIGIYCLRELETSIEIVQSGGYKFSMASGSKGGVAVLLRVAGQLLTLVNCHLEANRPALRHKQLSVLSTKLAHSMGFPHDTDLTACSDHVIWMGDFNYRIHTLDGETVLKLLAAGKHMEVHDRYDSMKDDIAMIPALQTFREPRKWPSFYPTYKKIPGRRTMTNAEGDPTWPARVYRVLFREPLYKGGKVKTRVPGWCDRILYSSEHNTLTVEQVECTEQQASLRDNYCSVNDALCESDHSPIFCTFRWSLH
ncbi:hypothetical protein Poli38472_014619 [Pythium oligandrum]|uniref:Inositol polyphosphate-related phosphatase domain-containing protein n=1 Tax=Pythium oligandrum TaxID=41045 RepID=A0A8K1FK84_PYTOL|nr:hypothetical protein Poli38472_014619 [Pythium oligandrum]|eukprot:TMW63914.1 hypothetical protein Poli38472_014619 [Pythium oligandrum]